MHDFQGENRWRAFFASRVVLAILLFFLLGMGMASFRALEAGWQAQAERKEVKDRVRELTEKKEALTSELEDLRSAEGVEREARQKLNFRKPGEEVVIIQEVNSTPAENDAGTASFWETIKHWFGIWKL